MDQRLEHLVGRLVKGARVLDYFLDYCRVTYDGKAYLPYAEQLAEIHQLTPNQAAYLQKTAVRARRARTLVAYLEKRFGVTEKSGVRRFRAPSALYRYMAEESAKGVTATSEGIMVEFNIRGWHDSDHSKSHDGAKLAGYTPDDLGTVIGFDTPTVMKMLHVGGSVPWNGLYYVMHPREEGPESYMRTKLHERRHVLEVMLPSERQNVFSETVAYAFSGESRGERYDIARISEKLTERKELSDRLVSLGMVPAFIVKKTQEAVHRTEEELKAVRETWAALREMSGEGFGGRDVQMLTYVISTVKPTQVPQRLRQVAEWHALHPWKPAKGKNAQLVEQLRRAMGDP